MTKLTTTQRSLEADPGGLHARDAVHGVKLAALGEYETKPRQPGRSPAADPGGFHAPRCRPRSEAFAALKEYETKLTTTGKEPR